MLRIAPPSNVRPIRAIVLLAIAAIIGAPLPAAAQGFGNHQLYMIRPDGTDLKQITNRPELRFGAPSISPDGKRIAADCTPARLPPQDSQIVVMDVDGSQLNELGPGSMPSWSPNGELLAFHTYTQSGAIVVMNADGTGREEVANHWGSPRWTPQGDKIICLYPDSSLRLLDLRTGKETAPLGASIGSAYQGFGVSRDGTKLCFGDQLVGGLGLATINKNWQVIGVKRYLRNSRCTFCSFSPDGSQIVFSQQPDDRPAAQVYILDVESDKPARWLPEQSPDAANVNPQWSPDGEWIIFTSDLPE